jgi:RNA polymerase sigma-70 factor, ECF subfamily
VVLPRLRFSGDSTFALCFAVQNREHALLFRVKYFRQVGIKTVVRWFTLVCVSQGRSSSISFEELAMPLFDRLYNFAHWLTQNREEAEDLVQETYAKALKGFSSFQPGTDFRAWIYRILRNTFFTSRTGLKTMVPIDEESDHEILPPVSETPESLLLQGADRQLVQSALEQLQVGHREILLLCEFEEMSYQEISATLAIPIGTVMSRLSRARRALREAIEQARGTHGH